jgi:hypothetical protein
MSDSRKPEDGDWLSDPAALVGAHEPANDLTPLERGPFLQKTRPRGLSEADDAPTTEVISRKEHARLLRRQAYQRAKQLRAKDPKHLALKEALKQRRREAYQQVKAKRKAAAAELKQAAKAARGARRQEASASLMKHVKRGADGASDARQRPRTRGPAED